MLALAAGLWRLPRTMLIDQLAVAVLTFAAVLLWRWSANMPQLNDDGPPGFSANDWLAPCSPTSSAGYADLRSPAEPLLQAGVSVLGGRTPPPQRTFPPFPHPAAELAHA